MNKKLLTLKYLYNLKLFGIDYIDIQESLRDSDKKLPTSIEDLELTVSRCNICEISKTRIKSVFGEGNLESKILFIGEAPGALEDIQGRVFVGRSGELLTKMIESVLGLKREDVYISNVLKCRPPENRTPTASEALSCKPYLLKQIEIIKPKIIVTLGATAYHHLTNDNQKITHIRGKVFYLDGMIVVPTFHPSYLLRNSGAKVLAYQDLLKIKSLLCEV